MLCCCKVRGCDCHHYLCFCCHKFIPVIMESLLTDLNISSALEILTMTDIMSTLPAETFKHAVRHSHVCLYQKVQLLIHTIVFFHCIGEVCMMTTRWAQVAVYLAWADTASPSAEKRQVNCPITRILADISIWVGWLSRLCRALRYLSLLLSCNPLFPLNLCLTWAAMPSSEPQNHWTTEPLHPQLPSSRWASQDPARSWQTRLGKGREAADKRLFKQRYHRSS